MTSLSHLSLQHCCRYELPKAPTNAERYQAFRETLPVLFGNTHFNFSEPRSRKLKTNHLARPISLEKIRRLRDSIYNRPDPMRASAG